MRGFVNFDIGSVRSVGRSWYFSFWVLDRICWCRILESGLRVRYVYCFYGGLDGG